MTVKPVSLRDELKAVLLSGEVRPFLLPFFERTADEQNTDGKGVYTQ